MAQIKDAIYKVHNGIDFDTIHLETSAKQVKMEDGSTVENKLTSHLAESAKKHITESGSLGAERGHYIKFDDGTLICRITRNKMTTVQPNTVSVVNWVFPAAFVGGVPTVLPAVQMGSTIYTANANVIKEDSLLQTDIAVKHNNPNPVLVGLRIIAIGRWK